MKGGDCTCLNIWGFVLMVDIDFKIKKKSKNSVGWLVRDSRRDDTSNDEDITVDIKHSVCTAIAANIIPDVCDVTFLYAQ